MRPVLVFLALFWPGISGAQSASPPNERAAVLEIREPAGPGPHPAVVLMHGCSGVTPTVRRWAARLADWGYVAVVLDSFGPRGVANVCGGTGEVPWRSRADDAFAAAAALRARAGVDPARVFAVGFSHGASSALLAGTRAAALRNDATPFAGIVSFYPACLRRGVPMASPVLILIGDADDWTPAARCEELLAGWNPDLGRLSLHVYPGATHAFDSPAPERVYLGHRMRHDAAATRDAAERLRRFLAAPG